MATIKVLSSGAFQIRVINKLLPKPFYATFDTREQAVAFSDQLTSLLAQGIVPATLAQEKGVSRSPSRRPSALLSGMQPRICVGVGRGERFLKHFIAIGGFYGHRLPRIN